MNPFEILGVPRSATAEEIKKARKKMAKKYHPDNFANEKDKADAEEKMKEVNAAYDALMNKQDSASAVTGERTTETAYSPRFNAYMHIMQLISEGRYDEAEKLLDGIRNPYMRMNAQMKLHYDQEMYEEAYRDAQHLYASVRYYMDIAHIVPMIADCYLKTLNTRRQEREELEKIEMLLKRKKYSRAASELEKFKSGRTFLPSDYYYLSAILKMHNQDFQNAGKDICTAMLFYQPVSPDEYREKYRKLHEQITACLNEQTMHFSIVRYLLRLVQIIYHYPFQLLKGLLLGVICIVFGILGAIEDKFKH